MSRLLALLEELGIAEPSEVWECAIIATIQLNSANGYDASYVEKLVGVFDKDGNPIPYVVLEGSEVARMPAWRAWTQQYSSTTVKIAFRCIDYFVIKVKCECYHGRCETRIYDIHLKPKDKLEEDLWWSNSKNYYEVVKNFRVPRNREEWIANIIIKLIDLVSSEALADQNKVKEILCKRICRGLEEV